MTVTLLFDKNSTTYQRDFLLQSARGLDDFDSARIIGKLHKHRDGSFSETIRGFNRIMTFDFGVLEDFVERQFLFDFAMQTTREIRYQNETIYPALGDPTRFENEWLNDLQIGKQYVVRFVERTVRTAWPSGQGVEVTHLMYFKAKVKIEGTPDSPETFTTGVGKLALMETGAAFPTFNGLTHKHGVVLTPYQEGMPYLVTQPSVSGGAVTFQLAVAYAGNPSADGFYYADIEILPQVI